LQHDEWSVFGQEPGDLRRIFRSDQFYIEPLQIWVGDDKMLTGVSHRQPKARANVYRMWTAGWFHRPPPIDWNKVVQLPYRFVFTLIVRNYTTSLRYPPDRVSSSIA
jgi:hypothetical protein